MIQLACRYCLSPDWLQSQEARTGPVNAQLNEKGEVELTPKYPPPKDPALLCLNCKTHVRTSDLVQPPHAAAQHADDVLLALLQDMYKHSMDSSQPQAYALVQEHVDKHT